MREASQYRFWFLFHRTSSPKRVSARRQLSAQKSDKGGTCLAAIKVEIKPIMRPATQFQCTSSIIPNRDVIHRLSNIDRKVRLWVLSFGVEPKFFVQVKPPYVCNALTGFGKTSPLSGYLFYSGQMMFFPITRVHGLLDFFCEQVHTSFENR